MLTDDEREQRQKQFRSVINKNIQAVIRDAMGYGISSKEPFRQKVTFQKLIDYKFDKETDEQKFQRFVTMADAIVENVKLMFPFINLDGIDLSWTTEELQNKIYEIFESTPEMNLQNCPRLSEEERKIIRKKKSQLQKELEAKLEVEFRRVFRIPTDIKIERRLYIDDFIERYAPRNERRKIEKYLEYSWGPPINGYRRERIPSQFEIDLKKVFPEVKEFNISTYKKFMDIMRTIKEAHGI